MSEIMAAVSEPPPKNHDLKTASSAASVQRLVSSITGSIINRFAIDPELKPFDH